MKFRALLFVPLAIGAASAGVLPPTVPYATEPNAVDAEILQYALTLEYLEAAYYTQGLAQFNAEDFQAAGYPPQVWQRLSEIAVEEEAHVADIAAGLTAAGVTPTASCEYEFPWHDVNSFIEFARVIESVAVSGFLYKLQYLNLNLFTEAAGSILTVDARHQALTSSFVKEDGAPSPFDTPLTGSEAYTLAASLIKSCPATNPGLPFRIFPALGVVSRPDSNGSVGFSLPEGISGDVWLHFYNGLTDYPVKSIDGKATLPKAVSGTVYVVASSSQARPDDDTTIAGPAIITLENPDFTAAGGKKDRRAITFTA